MGKKIKSNLFFPLCLAQFPLLVGCSESGRPSNSLGIQPGALPFPQTELSLREAFAVWKPPGLKPSPRRPGSKVQREGKSGAEARQAPLRSPTLPQPSPSRARTHTWRFRLEFLVWKDYLTRQLGLQAETLCTMLNSRWWQRAVCRDAALGPALWSVSRTAALPRWTRPPPAERTW